MRFGTMVLLGSVLAVGSIASLPRVCAEGPNTSVAAESRDGSSCADQYNALLGQAKASLAKGDRGAAINSLLAAKLHIRSRRRAALSAIRLHLVGWRSTKHERARTPGRSPQDRRSVRSSDAPSDR